jgi:hypothetical protein
MTADLAIHGFQTTVFAAPSVAMRNLRPEHRVGDDDLGATVVHAIRFGNDRHVTGFHLPSRGDQDQT